MFQCLLLDGPNEDLRILVDIVEGENNGAKGGRTWRIKPYVKNVSNNIMKTIRGEAPLWACCDISESQKLLNYAPVIGFPGMGDPGDTGRNRNFLH